MSARATRARPGARNKQPVLLFFTRRTSGPGRRMESLIAHVARTERERLRVLHVDADERGDLVEKLKVEEIPSVVLIKERRPVARLDGRATGGQIERLIERHVA